MKNITKSLLILLGVFAASCSSDDVEDRPVITPVGAPVLTAPTGGSYTLDIADAALQADRFVWTSADFDEDVAITYTLELDKAGDEFDTPQSLGSVVGENSISVSIETLNGAAMAAGGTAFEEGQFEMRVKASVNDTFEPMYSEPVTFGITPYITYPYLDLYLVGSATATGWDNSATLNMFPMYRDAENSDIYYYTGYFAAGEFKMVRKKGQWAPSYGQSGPGTLAYRATEGDPDPANIGVATAGYYSLTVNTADLTYTMEEYDASAATIYAEDAIGIIGTATPGGWDADTDMERSSFDNHIWYIQAQPLTAGGFMKFRANNDWAVNWGSGTSYSGLGTPGGPDIPIGIAVDGSYDIWFNDLTGHYIYIPVQ